MCHHARRRHHHRGARSAAADPSMRAGDAERQATLDRLAAHFAAGRLTESELEERATAAAAARTVGDLGALEADLPRLPRTPGEQADRRRRALRAKAACLAAWNAPWVVPVGLSWLI